MITVYSPRHAGHAGNVELNSGEIVPAYELPERVEMIRARIEEVGLGPIRPPDAHGLDIAARLHDPAYLAFLRDAWALWTAEGRGGSALPFVWPARGQRTDAPPRHIDGLLGYYSYDAGAGFVEGTWDAVRASLDVALTGAAIVADGAAASFALCRPPGHHAGRATAGGYCYVNNASAAAELLRARGASRVSVLDIDYHHGNGTQEIFYARGDVQVVNVHADPMEEYPYFLGHADERGAGPGEGFNLNLPLPLGSSWREWSGALEIACKAVAEHRPDVVVVSLGVDTYRGDPIAGFTLDTADYPKVGERIRALETPTVFVMEGGYAVEAIGRNTVGVLTGFEGG